MKNLPAKRNNSLFSENLKEKQAADWCLDDDDDDDDGEEEEGSGLSYLPVDVGVGATGFVALRTNRVRFVDRVADLRCG